MGVTFECPVHPGGACRQGVWFANPIDGGPPYGGAGHLWQRAGDTFDTLALRPSIHAHDTDAQGTRTGTHWHGFIGLHQPGVVT